MEKKRRLPIGIEDFSKVLEIGCDKALFDGLHIAADGELCERYMGQFPVLSVSLKGVFGECYETARGMLVRLINEEAYRVRESIGREHLSAYQQGQLDRLMEPQMRDEDLMDPLRTLSSILCGYHGKGTIILIDEYDVPRRVKSVMGA